MTTVYGVYGFLFFSGCKRVCLSEETAEQEEREEKGNRRKEMKERDPHPNLLLQALTGKYLHLLSNNRWRKASTITSTQPDFFYPAAATSFHPQITL